MAEKRFDIVREGATWTIGLGGPSSRGHLSRAAAIHAADEAAEVARAAGDRVEIFIWDGTEPTQLVTPIRHAAQ